MTTHDPRALVAELRRLEEAINEADDNCRLHRGDALRRDRNVLLVDNLPTILAALEAALAVPSSDRCAWCMDGGRVRLKCLDCGGVQPDALAVSSKGGMRTGMDRCEYRCQRYAHHYKCQRGEHDMPGESPAAVSWTEEEQRILDYLCDAEPGSHLEWAAHRLRAFVAAQGRRS